jgi:hypothetical protein
MSDSESNSMIDYFSVSEAEVSYDCFRKVFGVMTAIRMHPVHAIAIHASSYLWEVWPESRRPELWLSGPSCTSEKIVSQSQQLLLCSACGSQIELTTFPDVPACSAPVTPVLGPTSCSKYINLLAQATSPSRGSFVSVLSPPTSRKSSLRSAASRILVSIFLP